MDQVELQAYANLDKLTYPNRIYDIPAETPVLVNTARNSWGRDWKAGILKKCRFNAYGTRINDYWVDLEERWSAWFAAGATCVDRTRCCLLTDKPGDLEFTGNAFNHNLYQTYRDRIKELGIEPEDQYIAGFWAKPEGLEVVILEDPRGSYYGRATLFIYKQKPSQLTVVGHEWNAFFKVGSTKFDIPTGSTSWGNLSQQQALDKLGEQINWLIGKGWVVKRKTPKTAS